MDDEFVSITEIIGELSVSMATIRNWIKLGYLTRHEQGINRQEYHQFKQTIIGTEKLNKRANKLHIVQPLQAVDAVALDVLLADVHHASDHYENTLGESHRNSEGIYYTPVNIVQAMFDELAHDLSSAIFCDPCCGSGNFLIEAIERGVHPTKIFGYDTDPVAVAIAKARILDKTGYESATIFCADFLASSIDKSIEHAFDVILTNPPWGKKFSTSLKTRYRAHISAGVKVDSAVLFLLIALQQLRDGGKLGFLLPDAFFNIESFRLARETILNYQVDCLAEHGKPFAGLQTGAKSFILTKQAVRDTHHTKCKLLDAAWMRPQTTFRQNPKAILNFSIPTDSIDVLMHILALPHRTLAQNARWGLGIVTGNNQRFLSRVQLEGYRPVVKGADISKDAIKAPTNFIPADLSLYQQVAPLALYHAPEKLIYRFISSRLVFCYDDQQRLCLNSANMLVLHPDFPINHQQLCFLLNTRLMTWIFQALFQTHKVLRGDLEALPIFVDYFQHDDAPHDEHVLHDFLGVEERADGQFCIKD